MSTIYKFEIRMPEIEVEATTFKEALELAQGELEALGGSNTGSEMIYNAELIEQGTYECDHTDIRVIVYHCQRQNQTKTGWRKFEVTSTHCKKCKKHMHDVEMEQS